MTYLVHLPQMTVDFLLASQLEDV